MSLANQHVQRRSQNQDWLSRLLNGMLTKMAFLLVTMYVPGPQNDLHAVSCIYSTTSVWVLLFFMAQSMVNAFFKVDHLDKYNHDAIFANTDLSLSHKKESCCDKGKPEN